MDLKEDLYEDQFLEKTEDIIIDTISTIDE